MRKRAESGGNAVKDEERAAVEDEADCWTERREEGIVGRNRRPASVLYSRSKSVKFSDAVRTMA